MFVTRNNEVWKSLKGFPGYQISNLGRVKSFRKTSSGKVLKSRKDKADYITIGVYDEVNKQKHRPIHLLVILHFGLPKPSPKHQGNHIDGDKSNNWNTNLEWVTAKENIEHAEKIGLRNSKKENNMASKLTEKKVIKIRKLYKDKKYNLTDLSIMFAVSITAIKNVVDNITWKKS